MKYRITTVRSNETGNILYWRVEYKPGFFSRWRVFRYDHSEGQYDTFYWAMDTIAKHHILVSMDKLVKFKEEFV